MDTRDIRLIVDPPARGSWNMAVDEALFESAQLSRELTLRFYQWEEPTLSLGYFQPAAGRLGHPPSRECPLVRRSTGGGAILHDRELTYSLVGPIVDDRSAASRQWVRLVHAALIDVLTGWGLPARRQGPSATRADGEPFLCFFRRSEDDVVIGGDKILGSAQRRLHGTLLQHGSLLLGRSAAAPDLPGIAELAKRPISCQPLLESWRDRLAATLECRFTTGSLTSLEEQRAVQIEREKYAAVAWNWKR